MSENLTKFNNLIFNHLQKKNLVEVQRKWNIYTSSVNGRGIFAEDDIQPNEIIFVDNAIIKGPRASKNVRLHCVICCSSADTIKVCSKNCGLPICENCSDSSIHLEECNFIQERMLKDIKLNDIYEDLFRSLAPLRSLFIEEDAKELIRNLVGHTEDKRHGFELNLLKKYIAFKPEEEEFIKVTCSVLDSNAFETITYKDEKITSLRGLYPLSSIMNHNCVPNTTHLFDNQQNMIVKATVPIKKGTEIFSTYVTPFWSTQLRRHVLAATKHFWCRCERCSDSEEYGTKLGALKCLIDKCEGVILPTEPLKLTSSWKCFICDKSFSTKTIKMIQNVIANLLVTTTTTNPDELISLIKERLKHIVPFTNHITVELKVKLNWMLGHKDKFKYEDLSIDQLTFKEEICRDILKLLEDLRLGQCKLRGLVLRELYQCKMEIYRKQNEPCSSEAQNAINETLKEAMEILKDDATTLQKFNYVVC